MNKQILTGSCALLLLACAGATTSFAAPWKFGVISDTQWADCKDDGKSPLTCAAAIIKDINAEFIKKGVDIVVSVGDTVDTSTVQSFQVRSLYSQDLYNAEIGFYALRGNHDTSPAPVEFLNVFPQIKNGGQNNLTPVTAASIVTNFVADNASKANSTNATQASLNLELTSVIPPASPAGSIFVSGSNFSYPAANCAAGFGSNNFSYSVGSFSGTLSGTGGGASYSFDHKDARFIMLDQFSSGSGAAASNVVAQLGWIGDRTNPSGRPLQAFVFSHKNLLGGNHKDNLFGNAVNASTAADPGDGYGIAGTSAYDSLSSTNKTALDLKRATFDSFVGTLSDNNVRYLITGHDHHHRHSVVQSPLDSSKSLEQLILQSDSSKFYTPAIPFSGNETVISEELYQVGYYIFTVDGPRVTVDYYGVPANIIGTFNGDYFPATPTLKGNWVKRINTGYSLNGKEFKVAQNSTYTVVQDDTTAAVDNAASFGESGYVGTSLKIESGVNGSTLHTTEVVATSPAVTFGAGRAFTKLVHTGWAPAIGGTTVSDVVSLWGLTDLAASQIDTVTLSVTFNTAGIDAAQLASYCLGSRDPKTGAWINAVDANIVGGTKRFLTRGWISGDTLGSHGIVDNGDGTATAWAVVNGVARDFAVIPVPTAPLPWAFANNAAKVGTADLAVLLNAIRAKSTDTKYDLNEDGKLDSADQRWLTQHYTNKNGI